MAAANFQAAGTAQSGQTALTVAWPSHLADDIGLLVVETGGEGTTLTITAPSGWAAVTGSPVTDLATTAGSKLQVFWKRAASGAETSVTVPDSGDHQVARIFTFRGCPTVGNPWDVIGTNTKTTASTTVTWDSVNTTVDEVLCVFIASRPNDSASTTTFGTIVNANLTGIGEAGEAGTTAGHGGGFVVAYGQKVTAGAIGSTTSTSTASTTNAEMVIALRPVGISIAGNDGAAQALGKAVAINQVIVAAKGAAAAAGKLADVSVPYFARVTWAEAKYQASAAVTIQSLAAGAARALGKTVAINQVIAAAKGAARALGKVASLAVSITASRGRAGATGRTASLPVALSAALGMALASGAQASLPVGVNAGPGAAQAAGKTVDIGTPYAVRVTWAEAKYQADPSITLPIKAGSAVAAGRTASVTVYDAVRVTWAEVKYQASNTVTISPAKAGQAVATGPGSGATVSVDETLEFAKGSAFATGPGSGATVSVDEALEFGKGQAVAAGRTTTFAYGVQVTWAELQYQAAPTTNVTISPTQAGTAQAAGADVSIDVAISLSAGPARATGPGSGATVSVDETLEFGAGQAIAAGETTAVDSAISVSCGKGRASAAGKTAAVGVTVYCSIGRARALGVSSPSIVYTQYPDPADVREGVVYGPNGEFTGTYKGGGQVWLRRR